MRVICFSLALKLKQRVRDVEQWPIREVRDWVAYLTLMENREK